MNKLFTNAKFWTAFTGGLLDIITIIVVQYYPQYQPVAVPVIGFITTMAGVTIAVLFGGDAVKAYKAVNAAHILAQTDQAAAYKSLMPGKK
jgi:hypothetical protein